MMRFWTGTLLILAVALTACPKGGDGEGTPTPGDTPHTDGGADTTTIRYHWSGGFSIFEFYTLTLTAKGQVVDSDFVVKPVKGEKRARSEKIPYADFAALEQMFQNVKFAELEQKDRGMKIMDIGRTVITYDRPDADPKELYEDPDTVTTGDLKEIKAWFDRRVRSNLEAVSKPDEKTPE